MKPIQSALISVFYKDGIEAVAKALHQNNVTIYSTGGTQTFLENLGIPVVAVEDVTEYPEIFGGRVKTLHPKVFGGILFRRNLQNDMAEAIKHEIPAIDLVIVDLYPFEETLAKGASEEEIIEKIDIGGVSLIRAAAKNHRDVVILSHRSQYTEFIKNYNSSEGKTSLEYREKLCRDAFKVTSEYDSAIHNYFNRSNNSVGLSIEESTSTVLRYGENPHQKGTFYGKLEGFFDKIQGKELSYNNLLDVDAAVSVMSEFKEETTFAIIKHTNTCGLASRATIEESFLGALSCDSTSAFGGILIGNQKIDMATARHIDKLFYEVLIAPDFDQDALTLLMSKKNRIILKQKQFVKPNMQVKSILNGYLVQDYDLAIEGRGHFKQVTKRAATATELEDLCFALKACKHLKSNTITLVKNKQLIGMGCGQTSRVDALKQAISKAGVFEFDLKGAVMASDAFFPFPDCVEIAHHAGITAVVHPGGSVNDQLSIDYCDAQDMAMVTTGVRHFKH